jgi:hypothetical protein
MNAYHYNGFRCAVDAEWTTLRTLPSVSCARLRLPWIGCRYMQTAHKEKLRQTEICLSCEFSSHTGISLEIKPQCKLHKTRVVDGAGDLAKS